MNAGQLRDDILSGQPGFAVRPAAQAPRGERKPRALNPTRFICRSEVRRYLLEYANANRAHKFTRVSEDTLVAINERVRTVMSAWIAALPSKGQTI